MITLTDSIEINTSPEKVFNTLIEVFSSEESYKKWHKDHVTCNWVKGQPFDEKSVLYCEEYLHGEIHKLKFSELKKDPYKKIEYKILFPMSIICPRGSFLIEPKSENSVFTATLSIRFDWFFKRFAKKRIEIMTNHMKEEGQNLKKLIEEEI